MIREIWKRLKNVIQSTFLRDKVAEPPLHRFDVSNKEDAVLLLSRLAILQANKSQKQSVIVVGSQDSYTAEVGSRIEKHGFDVLYTNLDELDDLTTNQVSQIGCIVGCFLNSKNLMQLGLKLVKSPNLNAIPFEYILIPQDEFATLLKHDWQENTSFVSPLHLSEIDFFQIYEESLLEFERKCQIRDYMDLCQVLHSAIERDIEGDVAEFGSFRGHSGYLIARILENLGSEKRLYMFDMFEEFPEEIMGVDSLWNETHQVDFSEIKLKFSAFDNVTLVKGDFTETFQQANIESLCFVYVDCDSYRGTKFILETVFDTVLSTNGILVLEDYGHGPLLGNRLAFHEFFDTRKDCLKFFSQFSGFQIVVKL